MVIQDIFTTNVRLEELIKIQDRVVANQDLDLAPQPRNEQLNPDLGLAHQLLISHLVHHRKNIPALALLSRKNIRDQVPPIRKVTRDLQLRSDQKLVQHHVTVTDATLIPHHPRIVPLVHG